MRAVFNWVLRLFLLVTVLIAAAIGLAYYLASQSLPDYSRDMMFEGLDAPVEIVRDTYAVPHIFAESDHDIFFSLGLVHAQDRLWQMTMLRRTAQGRLSEMFGSETVEIDRFLRTVDIYGAAKDALPDQSPETRAALEAYADGVNAWIATVQRDALGRGAPEFFLFDADIAPWTPTDSLAILKLMALQMTDSAKSEVLRAKLLLSVDAQRARDLMPDGPGPGVMDMPDFAALFPEGWEVGPAPSRLALDPIPDRTFAGASNAFAAAPARTAGGGALLASDPHLGLSAPSIWMLARLEFPDGPVIGGTIPGMPVVLVGRNNSFSWGLTTAYFDDQDLYLERLTEDGGDYVTPDGIAPVGERLSIIRVKDGEDIEHVTRSTRHGPILEPQMYDVGDVTPPGHVMALSWTALTSPDRSMDAAVQMMRSKSVAEARRIGRFQVAPAQNVVMADANGNIALQAVGAAPQRNANMSSQGRIPAPGWLPENDWEGMLPYDLNPATLNPESGAIGNTNNKTVDRPFPEHIAYDWGDAYRILRLERLMQQREFHSQASFIEAQTDVVSQPARTLLPLIARELWYQDEAAEDGSEDALRRDVLERLADWTGGMDAHAPEPLIYAAWTRALQKRLIEDELGPLWEEFNMLDPLFMERVFRDVDGASTWCDIQQSTRVETCAEMSSLALDDALQELTERYGGDLESWHWGTAHQAFHKHQVLGDVPLVSWVVNILQDTPGGTGTLQRGKIAGDGPNPYYNVHAAGYRGVYDFSDPDASVFIISTGQSGHFLSRHYDDLAPIWRRGEYLQMSLDPAIARGGAIGTSWLTPAE
ncbi:penicillin acylase family protein [Paracoccaceae bacterium GXU_MW_L88]